MIVFYGINEDVPNDYGYIDVESEYRDIEVLMSPNDISMDSDRSWWIVPGTLED